MKKIHLFLAFLIFLAACSSPKKAPVKENKPRISKADMLRGGTSFSNPVLIQVRTESAGIDEEYKWLSNSYPGYKLIRRTQATRGARHFDIVRIKTRQGQTKDVYFDSTSFFGRI
jgi:hypothetical protein